MGKPNNEDQPTQMVPAQRAPIAVGQQGIVFQTYEDMWRFAQNIAASGMAPAGMERPETLVVAIQMGAELGLAPMQAVQNICVINKRPAVWGDAMLGLCKQSGMFDNAAFEERLSEDGNTAYCTVRRLPNGKPVTQSFSVDDAKGAGLWGKAGPWTQYPKRMLQMRARSWALRDTFADVLRGLCCAEEVRDFIDAPAAPPDLQAATDQLRTAAGVPT